MPVRSNKPAGESDKPSRKPYRRPELQRLGRIAEVTLGGSLRANENNQGNPQPNQSQRRA